MRTQLDQDLAQNLRDPRLGSIHETGDLAKGQIDFIVGRKIQAIFIESSVSEKNIQAIIEGTGAKGWKLSVGGELYSDAMGGPDSGADTYLTMFRTNIDTISSALK